MDDAEWAGEVLGEFFSLMTFFTLLCFIFFFFDLYMVLA